jgi:hypothetical protein
MSALATVMSLLQGKAGLLATIDSVVNLVHDPNTLAKK